MDNSSFLGQGWAFPPAFVKDLDTTVVLSNGDVNIKENLKILFDTTIGERIMEFGFGTKLKKLAFDKIDSNLVGNIKDTIKRAILLYERRIKLLSIQVDLTDSQTGLIRVQVNYLINQTNDRANYVYPFHLTEGTNLDL